MAVSLEAELWNAQYEGGRYHGDPPVPFVQDILNELGEAGRQELGLYVGCGNGRNFIPLLESGLNIRGIDIARTGINQLIEKCPEAAALVRVSAFDEVAAARLFGYVVAIQVFQHGSQKVAHRNFRITRDVLKPQGKLFLRVNSVSTEIKHTHQVTEQNDAGGFTVHYEEGPKAGTEIHFFSYEELQSLADQNGFRQVLPILERVEPRHEHADGAWSQWEAIWQKA